MPLTRGKPHPPTEKQIAYAKRLGLRFPSDITIYEISDLLDFAQERDKPPTQDHLRMADAFDVEYTQFIGKRALFNKILAAAIDDGDVELCRWFAFRVCRDIQKHAGRRLLADLTHPALQNVAEQLAADESIVRSIARAAEADPFIWWGSFTTEYGRSVQGGSRSTKAYKAAKAAIEAERLTEVGSATTYSRYRPPSHPLPSDGSTGSTSSSADTPASATPLMQRISALLPFLVAAACVGAALGTSITLFATRLI